MMYNLTITPEQLEKEIKETHRKCHWLLIYKENEYEKLDEYFDSFLFTLAGLNDIIYHPQTMIELISIIQSARVFAGSSDYSHKTYKKLIFDAHSLIDKVGEEVERLIR